ncbi:MAG TPA: histidine kinase, partial [Thermoanaerobaculia bacterium]|nr:histidine kinase [Thermoanaerobaculia bacterium]
AGADGVRSREEDEADYALVADELGHATFFLAADRQVLLAPGGAPFRLRDPLRRAVERACGTGPVLSIPFESEDAQGRLFLNAPQVEVPLMLVVADVVSNVISMRFEATGYAAAVVARAVTEERTRVARDLHDGLLQSFTGVVLQLETIHSTLEGDPESARRMITEAQAIIMADQRELRRFVEHLQPRAARREVPFDFPARLEELRSRFEKQWGMRIVFDVERIEPLVGGFLGQETFRLIHEAVTNSAKHGGASNVRVGVRTAGGEMHIEVADNGSGFPFHGRLTLDQIRESGGGPSVLAQRVHSLNGNLVVDSTDSGSTISISVPLGFGGV